MKICTYYVFHIHEDIRWLCKGKSSSMKWRSSWILNLIKTSTVQCRRSHRCHCITQYRSSWPSGMDQWLTFIMRSKRLLDMLLKECDFVSSFEVRSVASWTCSKLGAERRWCCLLHGANHTRHTQLKTPQADTYEQQNEENVHVSKTHTSLGGAALIW